LRNIPPIGAGGQPFEPDKRERDLWTRAGQEEAQLVEKSKTYDDPRLDEYLAKVGEKLLPDAVRVAGGPRFTFRVISDPTLNAFAMPNGHIYVHTGLLARLDNEAQLAMILGHEMTHVIDRHAVRFTNDAALAVGAGIGVAAAGSRSQTPDLAGAAVIGRTASVILGLGLQLAALASITGYRPDLEREADRGGMEKLVLAGYDPREAPRVFQRLAEDSGDRGRVETFFFGNQPKLEERIDTTRGLLATRYASISSEPATRDSDEFHLRTVTVVRDNAVLDIKAGRFTLAQRQLDRVLAIRPTDAIAHLYYGDLHRLQAQRARSVPEEAEHIKQALERYARAVELDPSYPDPFRQLGFLYYQQKDTGRAKEAFARYVALKPTAPDARRITEYLVELDR
jgi:predicted Zn-dependent protease